MSYRSEFPTFDFEIPFIEGFTDKSYRNDVCPSFYSQLNATQDIVLWVDFANPNRREGGFKQFTICINPINDEELDIESDANVVCTTDSWDEVIVKINQIWGEWA
tara:strand:+ start:454 stop:768 length:315 start_codon:yes stop_codon:yes gene_type:complete